MEGAFFRVNRPTAADVAGSKSSKPTAIVAAENINDLFIALRLMV
jgi:hypothetical protein